MTVAWTYVLGMVLHGLSSVWRDLVSWCVNFLGVYFAARVTWRVASWQIQEAARKEESRNKTFLLAYLDRVKIDLRDNALGANKIKSILEKAPHGRLDLFKWASTVASHLSTDLYWDFIRSGLHRRLLPEDEQALHSAYAQIAGLRAMAEEAFPAADFYWGYVADGGKSADGIRSNLVTYSQTVYDHVILVKDLYYRIATDTRQSLDHDQRDSINQPARRRLKDYLLRTAPRRAAGERSGG